jgi:hypothetical protein
MRVSSVIVAILLLTLMAGASCDKLEDLQTLLPHSRQEIDIAIMKALIEEHSTTCDTS